MCPCVRVHTHTHTHLPHNPRALAPALSRVWWGRCRCWVLPRRCRGRVPAGAPWGDRACRAAGGKQSGYSLGRSAPVLSTLDPGAHSEVGILFPRDENGPSRAPSCELRKTPQNPSEAWPPARRPWQDTGSETAHPINHCSGRPRMGELHNTQLGLREGGNQPLSFRKRAYSPRELLARCRKRRVTG